MKQTILVLSYVAKAAGFIGSLNAIPGVSPAHGIIIFFVASLLKDTANRIDDFLTTHFLSKAGTSGFARVGFLGAVAMASLVLLTLGLAACGTSGGSGATTPSGGTSTVGGTGTTQSATIIEAALPLVRTGAAVATGAVLDFAVQQPATRTRLANEMYSAANAVYSLSGGTFPAPAQFQSSILAFGGSQADASYAQFSTAIAGLYAAYYPKLETGDTKTATDLLNAIAGGIEDATASYVTTPAVTTSFYRDGAEAARVAHNHEVGGSSPSPGTLYELRPVARDAAGDLVYSF